MAGTLPASIASLLDGRGLAGKPRQAFPLITLDDAGSPHGALLSVGELLALPDGTLLMATWPDSRTTANLARQRLALLIVAESPGVTYLNLVVTPLPDIQPSRSTRLACFAAGLTSVRHDAVAYAPVLSGIEFELASPRSTVPSWRRTIAELRRMARAGVPSAPLGRGGRRKADMTLEELLVATITPLVRRLVGRARRKRAWRDITLRQYHVLRRLADASRHHTVSSLAQSLEVTAPVVTKHVVVLERLGMVHRERDESDRRRRFLTLTPRGRRRTAIMERELLEAASEVLTPLPAHHRALLAGALDQLNAVLGLNGPPDEPGPRRGRV